MVLTFLNSFVDDNYCSQITELTLFSPEKKHKEPWSPKQKIWSGAGGGKRKAEVAGLSSNDETSSKKRVDSKASSVTGSSGY